MPEHMDPRSIMTPSEDAKDAVITFAMFHFEALRESGLDVDTAKLQTADMIREVYDYYCEMGNIQGKGLPISVTQRISKLADTLKQMSQQDRKLMGIYSELVQIQAQLNRTR